jgi:hypothetical protein
VPSDLSRVEVKEEGNLLIEAVALLVRRQRESESWIAEQIWQAEERALAAERRYAELEVRLDSIEQNLARLAHDAEPAPGDAGVEERLARLREQVEGLKSGSEARAGRPAVVTDRPAGPTQAPVGEAYEPESAGARPVRASDMRFERRAAATAHGPGFWELLGASPQDRAGLLLIGGGAIFVVYAFLTQLRFS